MPDQGAARCRRGPAPATLGPWPATCGFVFAAFKGGQSPVRHQAALASCYFGGHEIWWTVQADSEADAFRLLASYIAQRTTITRVREAQIP